MARYQFEQEYDGDDWIDRGTRLMNLVVRAFGLVLMVVGLWIALSVISQAWSLYREPQNIERWVRAVERGSNLDKVLSAVDRGGNATTSDDVVGDEASTPDETTATGGMPEFRLSYFVAWIIAMLLLMLIGRLAIAAVKTGGELALYDLQMKRFARALLRENSRPTN